MTTVTFPRPADNVVARADQHGLWVESNGWTVPIEIAAAIEYANAFNPYADKGNKANYGFYNVETGIVLTHNEAKICFSQEEALAVIELIKAAAKDVWKKEGSNI